MGHRIRVELDNDDGDGLGQDYWKERLLGVLVDMLCTQPEAPPAGASQEAMEVKVKQVALPGLFALVEEQSRPTREKTGAATPV